ncbi:MAG: carboxypeptidase-like regulatory domain-containing protein [Prolixibacteraceae bacterium]|jgi:hypothetical protein|nr:carboxypeptidase-like regulatory domain-containing protein [Prolixibacteraceae bacterium]
MKTMFILFTLVCVVFQLFANSNGTHEIKGRVVDKTTGAPLEGVTISVSDTKIPIGTISDEKGEFSLWNIPANMNLKFSMDGYKAVFLDPANGHIPGDDPSFVVELESKGEMKKRLSIGNLLKNKKAATDLSAFAEK